MAAGILNPVDDVRANTVRQSPVLSARNARTWFDDALHTRPGAQDLNAILALLRNAIDAFGVNDVEGDDASLTKAITAAVQGLNKTVRVSRSASPYNPPGDGTVYFDITNLSGGVLVVNVPAASYIGQCVVFTDEAGTAGVNNFQIKSGGVLIDTIDVNGGWSKLRWNGATWLQSP